MKSLICLFACVAYVSATGLLIPDDGQWRPWLDNSILGASPGLATAALGAASVGHGVVAAPLVAGVGIAGHGVGLLGAGHGVGLLGAGHGAGLLGAGHLIGKRSLGLGLAGVVGHAGVINPNALNVPLDTVHVAAVKNAQLISQASEGARNILGGGIPAALPADTHEVAAGKVAHAIAHDTERALVAARGHGIGVAGLGLGGLGVGGLGVAAVGHAGLGLGGWGGAHGLGGWGGHGAW